jgi:hypothetical protein
MVEFENGFQVSTGNTEFSFPKLINVVELGNSTIEGIEIDQRSANVKPVHKVVPVIHMISNRIWMGSPRMIF